MRNRVRWEIENKGRGREREQEKVYFLSTDLNTKEIPPWATGRQLLRQQISASCLVDGFPLGIITCDYFQTAAFIPLSRGTAFYSR